ncbi:hypothetical protein ACRALDRAFT_1094561 [Sodiomyces alcalophilus JCM 7366]|uniref:uncharacterized protein n=1 Tax=Sodiomyces alcalophilus JCM 7366 TaxID=591952 RepID=UPI0039B44F07
MSPTLQGEMAGSVVPATHGMPPDTSPPNAVSIPNIDTSQLQDWAAHLSLQISSNLC